MMRSNLLDIYSFLFSRTRALKLNRFLFDAAIRGMGLLNYKTTAVSGEHHFLRAYLSLCSHPTVIDVGANEGAYSADIWVVNKDARVFAFEPHPETYLRLLSRTSGIEQMMAVNAACGSAPGRLGCRPTRSRRDLVPGP